MLGVAMKRLQNKRRRASPKKPKAPDAWGDYPYKELLLEFFWSWEAADFDPRFTVDGKPWIDQDRTWIVLLNYLRDLQAWATHRAENPMMLPRAVGTTWDKL